MRLHKGLGPGLLESVYEVLLARELRRRRLHVERNLKLDFRYDDVLFMAALRIDLLVEKAVVVELKSIESLARVHAKQLLTYLRLLNLRVGLLLNFGAPTMKAGIHRIINDYQTSASPCLRVR